MGGDAAGDVAHDEDEDDDDPRVLVNLIVFQQIERNALTGLAGGVWGGDHGGLVAEDDRPEHDLGLGNSTAVIFVSNLLVLSECSSSV